MRDFSVLETELSRNVHAVVKALFMEERTVQPKRRNAESVLLRDSMQLCAAQRKLSKDWQKKRMSYWVSSQRVIPERAKLRGTASVNSLELQDPWHAKIWVNAKKVNFRVDTRADVTVVPRRYFTKNSADPENKQEAFWPREDKN